MGKRQEINYIDKVMDSIDIETLQKMDGASFTAMLIAMVDVRTHVLDVCLNDEIFVKELGKDYVNDFIISVQEFAQCRQNFAKKYLYERIMVIDNGRCKDNSRRDT